MSLRWYSVVVDCADVAAQSRWWAETLGWRLAYESEAGDEAVIVPPHAFDEAKTAGMPREEQGPGLVFVSVPDGKSVKNRLHIDLAPAEDDDHAAQVAALVERGATTADIGQGDAPWVVLRDPEGNEFCVLTPRH